MQIFLRHSQVVEQRLQLHRVDKEDQGNYACIVTDHSNNNQTRREFIRIYERDQSFLKVWQDGYSTLHKTAGKEDTVQVGLQFKRGEKSYVQ